MPAPSTWDWAGSARWPRPWAWRARLPGHHRRGHQRQGLHGGDARGAAAGARAARRHPHLAASAALQRAHPCRWPRGHRCASWSTVFERIEAARGATTLTFFEYNTLAALLLFADQQGGRGGAGGGIGRPAGCRQSGGCGCRACCVRSASIIATGWATRSMPSARKKPGYSARGHPAVLGTPQMPASVYAAIEQLAREAAGCRARFQLAPDPGAAPHGWTYRGLHGRDRGPARAATRRRHPVSQCRDRAGRGGVARAHGRSGPALATADAASAWPRRWRGSQVAGRFQILPGPVEWILDVSHNEPAAQILKANLAAATASRAAPSRCAASCRTRMQGQSPACWQERRSCGSPARCPGRAAARRRSSRRALAPAIRVCSRPLRWPRAVRWRASLRGPEIGCWYSAASAP